MQTKGPFECYLLNQCSEYVIHNVGKALPFRHLYPSDQNAA